MKIYINPCPKPRMTQSDRWNKRPSVMRYRAFADELRLKMGKNVVKDTFHVIFTLSMPKSWSNKKRLLKNGKPHTQKPDTDNLMKAFKDALYADDAYVWDERGTKIWGEKGSIEIKEL